MTENDPIPPTNPVPPYGGVTAPGGPYLGPPPTGDDTNMALLAHLLGIFTGFLGPLVIWLMKKDTSPFVDDQGKESLNFQITLMIGYAIGVITTQICIGILILPAVFVVAVVFGILATVDASKGKAYRYPFAVRLVK